MPLAVPFVETVPLLSSQCAIAVVTVCHYSCQCATTAVSVPLLSSQCATAAATVCHCCRHSVPLLPSQCATAAVTVCHCCRHSVHCCRHSVLLLPCAVGSIRLQQPGPHGCRAPANSFSNCTFNCGPFLTLLLCAE